MSIEANIEANKDLVRRFYREIDAGNIDALDELVAEDYLDHSPPPFPGIHAPDRERPPGREVVG
jgi:ketosteroid isomerase-like protein